MCSTPVYLLVESVFLIFLVFYVVLWFFGFCNVSSRLVSCVPTICLDRQFLIERFRFL